MRKRSKYGKGMLVINMNLYFQQKHATGLSTMLNDHRIETNYSILFYTIGYVAKHYKIMQH